MRPAKTRVCLKTAVFVVVLAVLLIPTQSLTPTAPIIASPNTESSPSNLIFSFKLDNNLLTTSYLMVVPTIFSSLITPLSCTMLNSTILTTSCVNLNTASGLTPNPLTINSTAVNSLNPNIQSLVTIVLGFNTVLTAGVTYQLQILLSSSNNLPSIGALSTSFEMYVISGTGIMGEENWNMGQVFFEVKNNNLMDIVSVNSQVSNLAGTIVSTLQINIKIGVSCPTPLSVFTFTISGNFQFTVGSQVTSVGASPPQVLSAIVVSPNVITATFNEQFVTGRQFSLAISNIQNPLQISQGAVSVYSLPYNSISPLEVKELSIPYQTVSLAAIVNIYTAEGLTANSAVQFYLSTIQYVTVSIQLPANFIPSYILQITSDALAFQDGTVFARTNTVNFNSLIYTVVNSQTIQISGFTSIVPSGSVITVTMRVWINTNPIFNIYVSIDNAAHINANAPIIYGTASATVTATPTTYISGLYGNGLEPNKLTVQLDGTTSSIYFSVTPLFQTIAGSFLIIYTSPNLIKASSFNSATSCLINSVAQSCSISTSLTLTQISIYSSASANLFPQSVTTTVRINQVSFKYASSHSYYIYHFYFQLTVSLASQASVQKYLISPMVVQQRNQLSAFQNYFSNDIYNAGNNFMNLVRLVSPNILEWQNTIQSYQKRIISVFAYQGWSNGLVTVSTYSSYPCVSNLAGTTFTFIQGSNSLNLTNDFPINWDRINIVLPGTQSTTKFNIVIPIQYSSSTPVLFEVMVGIIDTTNGAITYLNSEAWPLAVSASTSLSPVNISVYSKPQQASMQFNIAGLAGSYMSNISFTVQPSSSFSASSYSAGLIVKSSWPFYDSTTSLASSSLSAVAPAPTFNNVEQTPICIQISSSSYLTYIPFLTSGTYSTTFNIYFNNVKLPYNMDPYYSMILIDGTGAVDGYNEFINQNNNNFYSGTLNSLSLTCNDNSEGVKNTYCTVTFTPFQSIDVGGVLMIQLTGMYVTTNMCTMMYTSNNVSIPIASCASPANNISGLTVTLANTALLPGLTSYSLTINGFSIDSTAISNYLTLQVMDRSGSYIVENKTEILITSVSQDFPIYITEVDFTFNNPVVSSTLIIKFTLPRKLYNDESFALLLSKDFTNLNIVPCKIRIQLLQADGVTVIPTQWILKYANSLIIFEGLQSALNADSYSIVLYGISTPSTVTQDMIGIIYRRNYDNTQTKGNTVASTAIFPSLVSKVNSLITLQTYFNTEGLQQQLQFTVINQYQVITQSTIWIVNFPRYYSPNIWNENYLIYCTISGTPLTCGLSSTPYEIIVSASPRVIQISNTYTISVFGVPCPRAAYLNGNNLFVTESIFFAMATSSAATAYSDYSELFVSNTVISPQSVGYGTIVLQSISSTNLQVYQTTFFTISLTCSVAIVPGYWIFITFPSSFNNFNNIPVVVQTQYSVSNFEMSNSSSVINFRIGYQINNLTIAANTQFQIMITSLVTGSSTAGINMNNMKVLVASSDRLTTYASSTQSRNQLSTLTFLPNALHLVINNYSPIQITAGTYSNPIQISASDNSTFLTNMMITFSSTQLTISPNPSYLYLGNSGATFIIGASQNMIPTTYSFNVVKKETSISAYYSTLSQYPVIVTSTPIVITVPASFSVPIGGCSMPALITITNPPYSNVAINLQYDTVAVPPNQFWVNQQLSYEQITFDLNATQRWISFCSNYTMAASSFSITMQLGGDNAASYSLSTSTTTVNIVSSPALNVTPTFTLSVANVQKTYASVCMTTNVPGFFFYHLQLAPLSSPLSIETIKSYIKANLITLQSNQDFLTTQIYIGDRDQRVGYGPALITGNNYVSINNLLPERSYSLCGYFTNQFGAVAAMSCISFTTQSWGTISKAYISFSSPILANQLNNVLCFFVKASNSQITQIIDLEGNSCSMKTSPQDYYYTYKGNTTSKESSSTIIYHTANVNLTTDASISAFTSLFDGNGITTTSLTLAQTQFSINFISSSYALTSFSPMTAVYASSGSFQPQMSLTVQPYSQGSYQVTVNNILCNVPCSVYFILVSYKNISTNQITSTTNITIKTLYAPTSDQVASCLDGSASPAVQCMRVVAQAGISYSFTLASIVENSVYALQYTVANEFPQRPVFYGGVQTKYIFTTNWSCFSYGLLAILLVFLLL